MTGGIEHDEQSAALRRADLFFGRTISPAGYMGTVPTDLIGRADDLARLGALLASPEARLVTVTGPAGAGKTRLVMEYFHRRRPAGTVEVFDFGEVTDAAGCRLGLRRLTRQCEEGSPAVQAALRRFAADRHTLLLDHHEDFADDLVPLLAQLRRYCPRLRIVSIGTTRLGFYGEQVLRLQPLPTRNPAGADPPSAARIPAVELFVQCARSVRPQFALTPANAPAVLALCRLTGGLPLAIELAAAQIKLAEPELILQRLERESDDLPRIGHHPYSRHSSIGDMVAWTLARLSADERTLLNQLAVFEGPFTSRAAAGVIDRLDGGAYGTMERLIDKSVLIPEQRPDGELNLTIPTPLRLATARALAQLPCHPVLRRAHGEYFRSLAHAHAVRERPGHTGTGAAPAPYARADLLAAFGYWREAGDGQAMAAIATTLGDQSRGTLQARRCLRLADEALQAGVPDPVVLARTLETAGELAMRLGSAKAGDYLGQALDAWETMPGDGPNGLNGLNEVVRCLRLLGENAYLVGELDQARQYLEQALARAGGADTPDGAAPAQRQLARRLAVVLRDGGDLSRADQLARTALAAELGAEDFDGTVRARYVLATIRWLRDDTAQARALFADAAEQVGGLPDPVERAQCLEMMAIVLGKWDRITDWHRVTAALGLANRLRHRLGRRRPRPLNELVKPILAAASQKLTASEYDRAWRAEPGLSWAEALRLIPSGEPAAEAAPNAPDDIAEVLTKRELEVALLVAQGLTNRAIAHKLGIAEWTVVNHLRKIMRKLDCQSRVHVTRRLVRR